MADFQSESVSIGLVSAGGDLETLRNGEAERTEEGLRSIGLGCRSGLTLIASDDFLELEMVTEMGRN